MRTPISPIFRISFLMLFFAFVIPQNSAAQNASEKNKIFEIYLHDKIQEADAQKIDAAMMEKKGIISCSTDAKTGKITVKVIPMIDFVALQSVINYVGYECKSDNVTIKEE